MGKKEDKFNDYEGFVEKFKPKRTTDDCYTPPCVYDAVLAWIRMNADIEGRLIVRPFYPGGDYERYDYPDGCIVIDNPPFSILSEILWFYQERRIAFFLFAPHLTLFKPIEGLTYIIADSQIVYENGATIRTGFITNLPDLSDYGIIGAPGLKDVIKQAQEREKEAVKKKLPTYSYPPHVVTSSSIARLVNAGIGVAISRNEMAFVRRLDAQQNTGNGIFGAGFLVSDRVAGRLEDERLRAEKLKAEKLKADHVFVLSPREREIIEKLNDHGQ